MKSRRVWTALLTAVTYTVMHYWHVPADVINVWAALGSALIVSFTVEDVYKVKNGAK
jgi:hypothetical protein